MLVLVASSGEAADYNLLNTSPFLKIVGEATGAVRCHTNVKALCSASV